MNQFNSASAGCTCPRCWLAPEQVAEGEHWPIPYGNSLVLCPKCGLVPYQAPAEPKDFARLKEGKQARAAFWASTRRARRRSNDPVGEAKVMPRFKETDIVRLEQGLLGFPSSPPASRPRAIEPLEPMISPYLTNEIHEWVRLMAARAEGTDSDVIRCSLSWAFEFRPGLKPLIVSSSKKRTRLPVRLKHAEMGALEQLARESRLVPGRYVLCLLEELRKKSTQPKSFRRILKPDRDT